NLNEVFSRCKDLSKQKKITDADLKALVTCGESGDEISSDKLNGSNGKINLWGYLPVLKVSSMV
ncbi:unnamed protein product, partial [Brassica napus]